MLIENTFTVDAPPDDVFTLMVDVERVAPCLGQRLRRVRRRG